MNEKKDKKIIVENLSFAYEKEAPILNHISFEVEEDDSVGLVGANGVGKSTLMKLLVGLYFGTTGKVIIDGIVVDKKSLSQIRQKIGYVFQDSDNQLFMTTTYEDVAFAPRNYGYSEEEVKKRVEHALESIGIMHLKDQYIYKMSGGEKKMASIATVLSMNPEILILDEPTIALDPKNRRRVIEILNRLKGTKVIVSHDLDLILDTCKRTILMKNGKILKDADTKEVLYDKELLESADLELPLCLQKK